MSVKEIGILRNAVINTQRGPSQVIWGDCPVLDLIEDPTKGMYFFDDFMKTGAALMTSAYAGSFGDWAVYGAAGALVADGQLEGGVLQFGSDGDNEGMQLLSSTGAFRFLTTSTLALNRKMWFECRFARSTITTDKADYFVGLMAPTLASGLPAAAQPITATDDTLMTAGDLFGFHSNTTSSVRGGPTEIALAFELTSGTINYPTNMTTLMASSGNSVLTAGAFVKVGFIFDPNAASALITSATARQTAGTVRQKLLRVFINGLEVPTFLTSADIQNATATQAFPTAFMCPVLAVMNSDGSSNTMNVDWIRVAQLANS